MDSFELAKILLGKKSNEGTNEKSKSTVMATGTATSDSSNGKVMVDMGGDTISYDDGQSVEIDTNISVKTGDIVQILLTGAAGTSKYPVVIGVIGRGDEQNAEIQEAKVTADQANSNSEEAKKKAEEAEEKAQTASENADSAKQSASAASELATSANTNANDAKDLANSANTASNQANTKAEQAETDAAKAIKTANDAQSGLADANKDISSLQMSVNAMNNDISDAQKKVKENGDAITGINQNLAANYATKTDVSDTKADIESDISTTASSIQASVKETYASKNDVSEIKGDLENKIQVNADGIESTSKKVTSLESDTQDISTKLNAASKTASDAQAQADTAVANAKAAQETADTAVANAKAADDKAKTAQSQLDTAKQNVASADAALKTAKQNYDSALSTYNSLTSSTTATEDQIKAAKDSLDSAQTALNKALADVLTANHNVTEAQTAANDALKNATTAYSNAATALTNAKTAQDTADKAVADAAKANKDLAALTSRVTTTETAIEQTNESITSLAKRTDTVENKFTGYYTKTETDSQINQKADSLTSTVSQTYETKTDSVSKLSSAKSYADSSSSQALKDAKADTDNKLKNYSTTTQMNSAINQKADSITSEVNKVNQRVSDIQVGGRNLLKGTDGTTVYTANFPSSSYIDFVQYNDVPLLPSNDFVLSFDAKASVDGVTIISHFYNPSNLTHCESSSGDVLGSIDGYCPNKLTTEWKRYWIKYTGPITDKRNVICARLYANNGSGTVYIRRPKLEAGNQPTDWSPAPEDVAAYTDSKVKQTSDSITATVSKKVGKDEVISSINQSAESVTINANKVNINGTVSANGNFKVDTAGNLIAKSATLENCTISGTMTAGTISGVNINGSNIYTNYDRIFRVGNGNHQSRARLSNTGLYYDLQTVQSDTVKKGEGFRKLIYRSDNEGTTGLFLDGSESDTTGDNKIIERKDLLTLVYPVGSIYISASSTSPASFIGGSWERLKDRFLLAAGDSYAAGSTGGEAWHTLSRSEMPSHTHEPNDWTFVVSTGTRSGSFNIGGSSNKTGNAEIYISADKTKQKWPSSPAGGSTGHNNMPPYLSVYMWKRVS